MDIHFVEHAHAEQVDYHHNKAVGVVVGAEFQKTPPVVKAFFAKTARYRQCQKRSNYRQNIVGPCCRTGTPARLTFRHGSPHKHQHTRPPLSEHCNAKILFQNWVDNI